MVDLQGKLTLVPGIWYAWQMVPGYFGTRNIPYCSPIFVQGVTPAKTGKSILRLDFINVGYAEGVQDFSLDLRVLKHAENYLVADLLYGEGGPDRVAIISAMEFGWLERFCPELWYHRPPSSVNAMAAHSVAVYLSTVFGLGQLPGEIG
jgi:hypothetical protein